MATTVVTMPAKSNSDDATFNPQRYLTKVGPADYLPVMWRLVWFREDNPDGFIQTELLEHTAGEYAVFKATASKGDAGGFATGYGSETKQDFRDYLEKAETKAIGRALAALGYGTQFSAHEFGGEAENDRIVDSPVNLPARDRTTSVGTIPVARAGLPPTEPQFRKACAVARAIGMTDADLHQFAGVASLNDFDRAGMSDLIERLVALEAAAGEAAESGADAPTHVETVVLDWTAFWTRAKGLGLSDKGIVEAEIGPLGHDPNHAYQRLQAWAKQHAAQLAIVS